MIVIATWLMFVVYPFYVYQMVEMNKAIVEAAKKKCKCKTCWCKVKAFFKGWF